VFVSHVYYKCLFLGFFSFKLKANKDASPEEIDRAVEEISANPEQHNVFKQALQGKSQQRHEAAKAAHAYVYQRHK